MGGYLNFPDLQRVGYLTESDLYDADEKEDEENAESGEIEEDCSSESKQKESEQKDHDEPYNEDQESEADSEEREIPEENKGEEGADAENDAHEEDGGSSSDESKYECGDEVEVSSDGSDSGITDFEGEEGPDKEDLRRLLDLLPLREASNIIARMIQKKKKMKKSAKANLTKVAKLRLKLAYYQKTLHLPNRSEHRTSRREYKKE